MIDNSGSLADTPIGQLQGILAALASRKEVAWRHTERKKQARPARLGEAAIALISLALVGLVLGATESSRIFPPAEPRSSTTISSWNRPGPGTDPAWWPG